jgi:hypothetical protein
VLQKTDRPYRNISADPETHDRLHRLAAASDRGLTAYLRKAVYIFETDVIFDRVRENERPRYVDGSLPTAESEAIAKRLQWLVHRIKAVMPQQPVNESHRAVALDLDTYARLHRASVLLNCKLAVLVRWLAIARENRWIGLMTAAEAAKYFAGTQTFEEAQAIFERARKEPTRTLRIAPETTVVLRRLDPILNHHTIGFINSVTRNVETNCLRLLNESECVRYLSNGLTPDEAPAIAARFSSVVERIRTQAPSNGDASLYDDLHVTIEIANRVDRLARLLDCPLIQVLHRLVVEYEKHKLAEMNEAEKAQYFAGQLTFEQWREIHVRAHPEDGPASESAPAPEIAPDDAGGGP